MAIRTGIKWCHHTMNFWWGCTRVTTECKRCYIDAIMRRAGISSPFNGPIRTKNWLGPAKWNRLARIAGEERRVFTCSMSDFFHADADPWREEAWKVIKACESLTWLILTKRPERIKEALPSDWNAGYENVWLGVTCGHSSSYYRLPYLKNLPARVKFISAEPLLEPLDFRPHLDWLDWIITGCEQSSKATRRQMNIEWVREIDQQCREFKKAHFFKQYYQNNAGRPATDGLLEGEIRQAFPVVRCSTVAAQRDGDRS